MTWNLSWKQALFVLASPTHSSCAGAQPQELGRCLCSQNLVLSSVTASGNDYQMTCRGLNLD